jgi:hypothetical protein
MTLKTLTGGNNEAIEFAISVLKTNLNGWMTSSTDPTIIEFVRRSRESITVLEDILETIQGVPTRLQQDEEILKLRAGLGTAVGIGDKLVRDLYARLRLGEDFEASEEIRKKHLQLLALRKDFLR